MVALLRQHQIHESDTDRCPSDNTSPSTHNLLLPLPLPLEPRSSLPSLPSLSCTSTRSRIPIIVPVLPLVSPRTLLATLWRILLLDAHLLVLPRLQLGRDIVVPLLDGYTLSIGDFTLTFRPVRSAQTPKSVRKQTYHSFPDFPLVFSNLFTAFLSTFSSSATLPPSAR